MSWRFFFILSEAFKLLKMKARKSCYETLNDDDNWKLYLITIQTSINFHPLLSNYLELFNVGKIWLLCFLMSFTFFFHFYNDLLYITCVHMNKIINWDMAIKRRDDNKLVYKLKVNSLREDLVKNCFYCIAH